MWDVENQKKKISEIIDNFFKNIISLKNLKNTIITWFLKPTSQWMVTEKFKIIQETVKESDKV